QGAKREADCAQRVDQFSNVIIAAHFALTRSPRRRGRGRDGHGETEAPCRFQVDEELDSRDQLDWQVRWLLALQDASGINTSLTVRLHKIPSVTHKPGRGWGSS